jgi:hypothetical protein
MYVSVYISNIVHTNQNILRTSSDLPPPFISDICVYVFIYIYIYIYYRNRTYLSLFCISLHLLGLYTYIYIVCLYIYIYIYMYTYIYTYIHAYVCFKTIYTTQKSYVPLDILHLPSLVIGLLTAVNIFKAKLGFIRSRYSSEKINLY